jgi:FAD synthase
VKIESHLLDHFPHENWWEETAEVLFHQRLREEIRFANVDALIEQITQDVEIARAWHEKHPQEAFTPLSVGV